MLGVYFIVAIILIFAVLACRCCCYQNYDYSIIANHNASDQTQPHYCEYEEILTPPSNFYHSIYGIDYQYYNEQNHNNIVDEKYKLYHEEK